MGKYGYITNKIIYFLTKKKYIFPRYANKINIYYKKKIIDDGILIYYPEPNSYTGESCIEFFLHNNLIILNKIIKNIKKLLKKKKIPFLAAKKGEFTFRAFYNKKINIFDIENIYNKIQNRKDIIKFSLRKNKKKKFFKNIKNKIENLIIYIEDSIIKNKNNIENIIKKLKKIIKNCKLINKKNIKIDNKIIVSIIGKSNVGKSSLFNFILKKKRSIVYNKKGTTRDTICEEIKKEGIKIKLFDTAGINNTNNKVEKIGIKKTLRLIKKSDILIEVLLNKEKSKYNSNIIIINKIDKIKSKSHKKLGFIYTSLKYNIGIRNIFKKIIKISKKKLDKKNEKICYSYNIKINKKIKQLVKQIKIKDTSIILSVLNEIKKEIGYKNTKVLKKMLKKFCIGK